MNSHWREVKLGEHLIEERDTVASFDGDSFPVLGVTNDRGVTVTGITASEDKSKYLRLRPNRFVYNPYRINVGSIGLSSELQDGIVSPAYVVFRTNESLLSKFLYLYLKSHTGNRLINFHGNRGTVRAALRFDDLCSIPIPLPPLPEQERIVARIDELAKKIEDVGSLRLSIEEEAKALSNSLFQQLAHDAPLRRMKDIAPLVRRQVEVKSGVDYPELGIRSFGKGTFHKPSLDYVTLGTKRIFKIEPGDLLFSNVFAWEGAIAVAQSVDSGRFGSHRFISCVTKKNVVTPEWLCYYFLTPDGIEKIRLASPGGAGRNRTLGLNKLAEIEVPVPDLQAQMDFNHLLTKLKECRHHSSDNSGRLSNLMVGVIDSAFKGEL